MNIVKSRWRLACPQLYEKATPKPDPAEVENEKWWAESAANIARLKAKGARLERELAELRKKVPDWLVYLPRKAGSPDLMKRAAKYLEEFRTRIEAAGARVWLCKDHDYQTRVFEISEFRAQDGQVFCRGLFLDEKYRELFKGVSPDISTFAGDFDLCCAIAVTPNAMRLSEMPDHIQAAARSPKSFGVIGAVCLDMEPGYGRSAIFRLK